MRGALILVMALEQQRQRVVSGEPGPEIVQAGRQHCGRGREARVRLLQLGPQLPVRAELLPVGRELPPLPRQLRLGATYTLLQEFSDRGDGHPASVNLCHRPAPASAMEGGSAVLRVEALSLAAADAPCVGRAAPEACGVRLDRL